MTPKDAKPKVYLLPWDRRDELASFLEEAGAVWRLDTRRDKAEQLKKHPLPTARRQHSMIASPSREQLAIEVEIDGGFELRVLPLG